MPALLMLVLMPVVIGGGVKPAGVPPPFVDYSVSPVGRDRAPNFPDIQVEPAGFDEFGA